MISAMTWLIAVLLFLAYAAYLARVVREDDRGHRFTHQPPPASHRADTVPVRAADGAPSRPY